MRLHDAEVVDTFAEAFPMWGARIVVTAETPVWAGHAARALTAPNPSRSGSSVP